MAVYLITNTPVHTHIVCRSVAHPAASNAAIGGGCYCSAPAMTVSQLSYAVLLIAAGMSLGIWPTFWATLPLMLMRAGEQYLTHGGHCMPM